MDIRPAREEDFGRIFAIFCEHVEAGETYVFEGAPAPEEVREYWLGPGVSSFVLVDGGRVEGMYRLVPNQRGRGAHVANASFMVSASFQGRGSGRLMGEHCLTQARLAGYRAMQFNFVVSTNEAAVHLWKSLGFSVVGVLPGAFRHERLGYVDAFVMFRDLGEAA